MAAKLRPLHDRVLIKRVESDNTSKGGIIIPDNAKEKPLEGEVVAIGTGRVLEDGTVRPLTVKAGDRVLFSKWTETEVKVGGDTLLLMREDDLLGIIEGDSKKK
jgi:chaperonin GroES